MKILVDTNVFLDFFLRRDNLESKVFFDNCFQKRNPLFVTSLTLRDVEYISHNILHSKKESKEIQFRTYRICSKVVGVSADATITSLYSNVNDYEDALQIEAAKEAMLDCIVTNNKKDFEKCGIPIFTPKELNEIWSNQDK